jgi:hypothetical protein
MSIIPPNVVRQGVSNRYDATRNYLRRASHQSPTGLQAQGAALTKYSDLPKYNPVKPDVNEPKTNSYDDVITRKTATPVSEPSVAPIIQYSVNTHTDKISYNEGTTAVFDVAAASAPDGLVLYWTTDVGPGITAGDFVDNTLTGQITISNNQSNIIRTILNDLYTEGPEEFSISIRRDSITGPIVATSPTVTINDTSCEPIMTPSSLFVNKGDDITITISTTGVPDGTTLTWYCSSAINGTISYYTNDVYPVVSPLSGEVTILATSATFVANFPSDGTYVGDRYTAFSLANPLGTIIAYTPTITVYDTTKTYNLSANKRTIIAGGASPTDTVTFDITTSPPVQDPIDLYWTTTILNSASIPKTDFTDNTLSGKIAVIDHKASLTRIARLNGRNSTDQFTITLHTASASGPIVGNSNVITKNNAGGDTFWTFNVPVDGTQIANVSVSAANPANGSLLWGDGQLSAFNANDQLTYIYGAGSNVPPIAPGVIAAYSLRKIYGTYTGYAVNVKRLSDNTTLDIGFNSDNELDTVALNTFCTGTSGIINTWYDQSGYSYNAVVSASSFVPTQPGPLIYDNNLGGVLLLNNKPTIRFDAYGPILAAPDTTYIDFDIRNIFFVSSRSTNTATIDSVRMLSKRSTDFFFNSYPGLKMAFGGSLGAEYDPAIPWPINQADLLDMSYDGSGNGTGIVLSRNSAALANSTTTAGNRVVNNTAPLIIGNTIGQGGQRWFLGSISEIIIYAYPQSKGPIQQNIIGYYNIVI